MPETKDVDDLAWPDYKGDLHDFDPDNIVSVEVVNHLVEVLEEQQRQLEKILTMAVANDRRLCIEEHKITEIARVVAALDAMITAAGYPPEEGKTMQDRLEAALQ